MIILELTNSCSAYGTLRKMFRYDDKNKHLFGENEEVDYQIEKRSLSLISDVTKVVIESIDKIRIWFSSLNTNDQLFVAFMVETFKENKEKIVIIDVADRSAASHPSQVSVACNDSKELKEMQEYEKLLSNQEECFYNELLDYYFNRNENLKSFIMVNKNTYYELKHSDIKKYILETMPNYVRPSHIIGCVMSSGLDDKGWWFGDNVIYKFIIDLINESKLIINSSYNEYYQLAPVLYKK